MQSQPPPTFALPQSEPHPQPPFHPEPTSQASYPSYTQPPLQQVPQTQPPQHNNAPYSPTSQIPYSQSDYPRGPASQATAQQSSGVLYNNNAQPSLNPIFGLTLEDLFRRDGSPVPMVVYQCIQAVDLFGLEVEGIYRIPGTSSHIQQMKALFDSGTCSSATHNIKQTLKNYRCLTGRLPKPRSLPARCQQCSWAVEAVLP
jgi:hypothetical protein